MVTVALCTVVVLCSSAQPAACSSTGDCMAPCMRIMLLCPARKMSSTKNATHEKPIVVTLEKVRFAFGLYCKNLPCWFIAGTTQGATAIPQSLANSNNNKTRQVQLKFGR
ncbi:hypothetical protein COO60DRAFT_1514015 [Scenedesmus sp. NREL 46B-D3]|nr:hypothetical protein COO60DRAFT_1514015 [Scenedesmus sp. NREL 46B-D3]